MLVNKNESNDPSNDSLADNSLTQAVTKLVQFGIETSLRVNDNESNDPLNDSLTDNSLSVAAEQGQSDSMALHALISLGAENTMGNFISCHL